MDKAAILKLIHEIDTVDFKEFWWGSGLLERCSKVKDPRIVNMLLVRHQHLGNKEADSAHLLRNTIKEIDGPGFETLWSHIDNFAYQRALPSNYGDQFAWPEAAGFVLGEIGGAPALQNLVKRLIPSYSSLYDLLGTIAADLLSRYLQIRNLGEPTVVIQDIKTREKSTVPAREFDQETYERQVLRRKQENDLFVPVEKNLLDELGKNLSMMPPKDLPVSLSTFRSMALDVPIKNKVETSYLFGKEGTITGGISRLPNGKHLFVAGENPDVHTMIILSFVFFASSIPRSSQVVFSRWAGLPEKDWSQDHKETFALTLYNYFLEIKEQGLDMPAEVMGAVNMLIEKGAVPSLTKELTPEVKEVFRKMFVL